MLNTDKSFFMVFKSCRSNSTDSQELQIYSNDIDLVQIIGNFTIKRTYEFKYLGLILDETLKFDKHIDYVIKKTSSASGILWKMRHQLPQKTKKLIFQTALETHLLYMFGIRGSAPITSSSGCKSFKIGH